MEIAELYILDTVIKNTKNVDVVRKEYRDQANKVWQGVIVDYVELAAKKAEDLDEQALADYLRNIKR